MEQAHPEPENRRLGDFEIGRELGRGGMGIVYEARQVSLNRRVALKVLAAGLGLTAKAVQRFRREAEAAARLHHTNIVPVYATGEAHGTHFYAMELINGPSLDHVLRRLRPPTSGEPRESTAPALEATGPYLEASPLSPPPTGSGSSSLSSPGAYFDSVARMIAEVADALHYAHRQGVIHRDVKPSNLLLSPDGRLSVNDFGLARMLEQPGMTLTGEFVGTPAYMSPEQIAVGRTPLDHRTDVYSLGATLYELLTLQMPFQGERRDQILAQILHKEPRPPRKVNRRVPVDLETICLKALERDPDRRYQTAGAMAEDLRRFVNRFAIAARRAGPVERLRKWVRRHPGLAAGLACTLVALIAAGFFAYRAHEAEGLREAEQRQAEQRLREEKREAAVQRALLAAKTGKFNEVENEIQEAERWGASTGQVRFLYGMLAYYRDQTPEAIRQLEQAIRLLPESESAAARGLLCTAYLESVRWDDYDREMRTLEPIAPVTFEDYLFKGQAISLWDPRAGLELIDEAVHRQPSSAIARLARAEVRTSLAQERGDPGMAALALDDVNLAANMLPANEPLAPVSRLGVECDVAGVYADLGLREKLEQTQRAAEKDIQTLRAFPNLEMALLARINYAWYFTHEPAALDEALQLARRTKKPVARAFCGYILYLRGSRADLQEARAIAEAAPEDWGLTLFRCCVLAELEGPARSLEAYRELVARDLEAYQRLRGYTVPLLLGRLDLAREAARHDHDRGLLFPPRNRIFLQKIHDYVAGNLTENQLLEAAADSRWNGNLGRYFIAMTRLAEGDRAGAREQFRKVIQTRTHNMLVYDLSILFLSRMDKDPNWPPWIPVKK